MKKLILLIITAICLSNCASFSTKIIKEQITKLDRENIQNIEGSYALSCYDAHYLSTSKKRKVAQYENHIDVATVNSFTNTIIPRRGTDTNYTVDIKLLSDTEIQFTYRSENAIVNQTTLSMKLRKNGMIHLKNRETSTKGVPMIFGNISVERSRIGIRKNRDLILNNVEFIAGGFLILFGDGRRSNTTFYFKRIITPS
ncbi:hypothetical protein [Kordia sp.]|uniref:hypothetical protein n=1 Tax=Kordia sp. TaxID=1965332 RepID=UPI003D29A302